MKRDLVVNVLIVSASLGVYLSLSAWGIRDFIGTAGSWCGTCAQEGVRSLVVSQVGAAVLSLLLGFFVRDNPSVYRMTRIPFVMSAVMLSLLVVAIIA